MVKTLLLFLCASATLFSRDAVRDLKDDLNDLLRMVDSKVQIGIEVVSMRTGERLYGKDSERLFVPAHLTQLFTAAAALNVLGVDYRFETKLFLDEEGNLYLKGAGDPSFSRAGLKQLAVQLKASGVTEIAGNLFIDDAVFDVFSEGPGWAWDGAAELVHFPVSGLMIDHNALHVWVTPGEKTGDVPQILLDPELPGITVENLATTQSGEGLKVDRLALPGNHTIQVKGSIPPGSLPREFRVPLAAPSLYVGRYFQQILAREGIEIQGEIIRSQVSSHARYMGSVFSSPLSQIVQAMLEASDVLYADSLFKKLGAHCFGAPGSWQKGAQSIREFLMREPSIDPSTLIMLDGAGVSRYNRISPRHATLLLGWLTTRLNLGPALGAGLPTKQKGQVRASTGKMTGVTGMAGYATTRDDELLAFAILINGATKPLHELEQEICSKLTQFSRKGGN